MINPSKTISKALNSYKIFIGLVFFLLSLPFTLDFSILDFPIFCLHLSCFALAFFGNYTPRIVSIRFGWLTRELVGTACWNFLTVFCFNLPTLPLSINEGKGLHPWVWSSTSLFFVCLAGADMANAGVSLNPASSLAKFVKNKEYQAIGKRSKWKPWRNLLRVFVVQVVGAALGVSAYLAGLQFAGISATNIQTPPQAQNFLPLVLVVELIATLVMVVSAYALDFYRFKIEDFALLDALVNTLLIFASGPWSGACMNPASMTGVALATRWFLGHTNLSFLRLFVLYWVGPCLGGLLAVPVFRNFQERKENPRKQHRRSNRLRMLKQKQY